MFTDLITRKLPLTFTVVFTVLMLFDRTSGIVLELVTVEIELRMLSMLPLAG
jgi:hypothetical protein